MKSLKSSFVVLLLICSAFGLEARAQSGSTSSPDQRVSFGSYNLYGWQANWPSSNYLSRSWYGNAGQDQLDYYGLGFNQNVANSYVGLDFGVGYGIQSGTKVNALSRSSSPYVGDTMKFRFSGNLVPLDGDSVQQDGFWYMGPKTIIYNQPNWDSAQDLQGDNFECYIVEKSNLTRAQFFTAIYYAGGALNYRTTSYHWDGEQMAQYDHFTRSFNGFTQVFAIRVGWKDPGGTETQVNTQVNWIQHIWMTNGIIPNSGRSHYNLGWKANIEFAGKFGSSYCGFSYLDLNRNPAP